MAETRKQLDEMKKKLAEFVPVMDSLSRARNPFELRYFVIGKHDDRVQQYKQAVIEMDVKYKAVQEGLHGLKLTALKREELELKIIQNPQNRQEEIFNQRKRLRLEKLDREEHDTKIAITGAFKEVMDFITIIENEYADLIDLTEEELLKTEVEHWKKRFAKQIAIDKLVINRIGEGNLSALMSMPKELQEHILIESTTRVEEMVRFQDQTASIALKKLAESYPRKTHFIAPPDYVPLKLRKEAPDNYPSNRIVNIDRAEIMIATLHRPGDTLWLTENFYIPSGKNNVKHWVECPNGDMIGEWRNRVVKDALSLGCTHLFFVDDDLVVDPGVLMKLYERDLDVVGGWYCKKTPIIESATLVSVPNSESKQGVPINTEGIIEVDWSLTAGLTLIKMDVFKKIPYPWYNTMVQGTEDTYFCARLREVGIKSYLDTSLKADHVDKSNGDSYGFNGIEKGKYRDLINSLLKS